MIWLLLSLGYGTPNCIGNPPARFQGNATVIVHFTDHKGLDRNCGRKFGACSIGHEMWVRNPCPTKEAKNLTSVASDLCHEIGHVHGWGDNHPR